MTGSQYTVTNGAGTAIKEYQASVNLGQATPTLVPNTRYCYAVFSSDKAGATDLLPAAAPYQTFTTLDPVSASSTTPVTFDVIADTGENYAYTSSTASNDLAFPAGADPAGVNPDQASLYNQIGKSGANFLMVAGDIGYSGGNQSTYGDLQQTGSQPEVSNIFSPYYFPQTGGIPTFAADGNHGQNVNTLKIWPTETTAGASGGTYAFDSYAGTDGISGSFPDDWYAFSTGNVRIYVIDGAWADGSTGATGTGSASGSECPTPSYCEGYQADADEHWQTNAPEYKWLRADLAAHPGGVKFAVFHYPLRSDNSTQPSDVYEDNSSANPHASTSLEALLATNGVDIAFNGHAHTYQRIVPKQSGQIINYVTGGGGGVLEPVQGGSTCKALLATEDVYALGWSPSHTDVSSGTGSYCGPAVNQGSAAIAAATPASAAQVYSFLKVTVAGDQVTVTPYNAAGGTFDVQTYRFGPPNTAVPTTPAGVSASALSSSHVQLSWLPSTESGGTITSYLISRNGTQVASVAGTQASYSDTAVQPSTTYRYTVTAVDGSGNHSLPGSSNSVTTPAATSPPPGPTLVQDIGSSTSTVTLHAPSVAGDLLVLNASLYTGSSNHVTSVTDSAGDSWQLAGTSYQSGHNSDGELWYLVNAPSVSTVTVITSASSLAIHVEEFGGVSAFDTSSVSSGSGTVANSGAISPSVSGELAVGFVAGHASSQAISAPSGFTNGAQTTTGTTAAVVTGYKVLPLLDSVSYGGSFAKTMYWAAGVALFRPDS